MFTMMNQLLRLSKALFSESICSLCLKRIVHANMFPEKFAKNTKDKTDTKEETHVFKWESHYSKNVYMFKSPNMSNCFVLLRQTCSQTRLDMN